MKNKLFFAFCLVCLIPIHTKAQEKNQPKGRIKFTKDLIDLGSVKEEGGIVSVRFTAYNISSYPVTIKSVHPTCGCTTADWSKDPIDAGDSGFVDIAYNPLGKPGAINEGVVVNTDGAPWQFTLRFSGEVTPRARTKEDDFPHKFGSLMMTKSFFDFGFMHTDEVDTFISTIYNSSIYPVEIKGITGRPDYIVASLSSTTIPPKGEARLTVILNAKAIHQYGDYLTNIELITDDPGTARMTMYVQVHVMERFKKLSARKAKKVPRVSFDTEDQDFGKILKGDSAVLYYRLTNTGKSTLSIRRLQPSCGCTASTLEKNEVKPGETVTIKVVFNTAGRSGKEEKSISVITNDPARPVAKITLRGEIVMNPNAL
jgi:hypothetical protein